MLPLRRQLQLIFAQAAYKTHSNYLLPSVSVSPTRTHPDLTFQVDIAQQLHEAYKRDNFRYTDKGTTPASIAQEIAVYTHSSPHYSLEIDSFAKIMVTPTKQYAEESLRVVDGKVRHAQLEVRDLGREEWMREEGVTVLYEIEDMTLTTMRMVGYIEAVARKMLVFGQFAKDNVVKVVDVRGLGDLDIAKFWESGVINMEHTPVQLIVSATSKINQKYFKDYPNAQVLTDLPLINAYDGQVIAGCLSHLTIPYSKKYSPLLGEKQELFLFGEVQPNTNMLKLQKRSLFMNALMRLPTKVPVNLRQKSAPQVDQSLEEVLGQRKDWEKFILIMDSLGQNNLSSIFSLDLNKTLNNQTLSEVLSKQLHILIA